MNDARSLDIVIGRGAERRRLARENIELTKQRKELNVMLPSAYSRVKDEKDYIQNKRPGRGTSPYTGPSRVV